MHVVSMTWCLGPQRRRCVLKAACFSCLRHTPRFWRFGVARSVQRLRSGLLSVGGVATRRATCKGATLQRRSIAIPYCDKLGVCALQVLLELLRLQRARDRRQHDVVPSLRSATVLAIHQLCAVLRPRRQRRCCSIDLVRRKRQLW